MARMIKQEPLSSPDRALRALRLRRYQAPEGERTAVTALTLNYVNQVLVERQNLLLGRSDREGEMILLAEPEGDSAPTGLRTL
jgi:hypothetical protein